MAACGFLPEKEIMRIVLEDKKTRRFMGARGWTKEESRARDFESSLAAIDYCFRQRIREVRILLAFDEKRFNFYLDPFSATRPAKPNCRATA
jgi:hypothetical protein